MTTQDPELSAALGWPGGISDPVLDRKTLLQMVAALRLASKQALEVLKFCTPKPRPTDEDYAEQGWKEHNAAIASLRAALAQPVQDPVSKMTTHRAIYFMERFKREEKLLGPNEQAALDFVISMLEKQAEPVEEPVAWLAPRIVDSYSRPDLGYETCSKSDYGAFPAYTAPPQRTMVSLTEEEILAAVGWERAAMYMKLTPNFPVDEAKQETLKNARAVERAVWEKNHGQA